MIYHMPKTELRLRRYKQSKIARKLGFRGREVNRNIPDPDLDREETRERDAGRWGSGAGGARWGTREKGGSSDALPAARVRGGGWASRGKWAGLDRLLGPLL